MEYSVIMYSGLGLGSGITFQIRGSMTNKVLTRGEDQTLIFYLSQYRPRV